MKFSLVLGLLCAASSGKILSYEEIKNEPKSLAKDYYIYRLIDETKYNKAEIRALKQSIFRYKGKLKDKLDRIFGAIRPPKRPDRCAGVTSANILDANLTCKKARSYPNFIAKLSPSVRETLASQLESHQDAASRNAVNLLRGFNDENPSEYFMQSRNAQNYFLYYDYLKGAGKDALIDINADAAFVSELASQKGFKAVLNDALINRKYPHLRRSLTGVDPSAVEKDVAFMLGVNAVMQGDEGAALAFFSRAAASFEKPHDVHNAKFWIYLLNGDQNVLRQLDSSDYYSLYALYAKEVLGDRNLNIIIPNPAKNSIEGYDITDPFAWVRTKNSADRMSRPQLLEFAKKRLASGERLSAGVDTGVYAALLRLLEKLRQEVDLEQRFSTAHGDAAIFSPIGAIAFGFGEKLFGCHLLPLPSFPSVGILTIAAAHATTLKENDEADTWPVNRTEGFRRMNVTCHIMIKPSPLHLPHERGCSALAAGIIGMSDCSN